MTPGNVGDEMLAGRVTLIVDGEASRARRSSRRSGPTTQPCRPGSTGRSPTTPARPSWPRSSRTGSKPARTATKTRPPQAGPGRAAGRPAGNERRRKLLAKVVDVEDAATGTVRLKRTGRGRRRDGPDTRSTKTVRVKRSAPRPSSGGHTSDHGGNIATSVGRDRGGAAGGGGKGAVWRGGDGG